MPVTAKQIIHGKIRSRKKLLQKHQKTPETLVFLYIYVLGMRLTVTAKANHSRKKQITHGKSISLTAKQIQSRQKQIRSRQNQFALGKIKSLTAKTNKLRMRYFYRQWRSVCSRSVATLHCKASVSLTVFSIEPRFASYC